MAETGVCHICLEVKPLTFEHVPPRRAYNHQQAFAMTMDAAFSNRTRIPMGINTAYRQGLGVETLCKDCNGFTGDHYGEAFAEFATQALRYADSYVDQNGTEAAVLLPFDIKPLLVLKQIATMALAVSPIRTDQDMMILRHFVLKPYKRLENQRIRFRVYLTPRRKDWKFSLGRLASEHAVYDMANRTMIMTVAEIALPPLGYWIARHKKPERWPEEFLNLADITGFGFCLIEERRTVFLKMPIRTPDGPVTLKGKWNQQNSASS